MSLKVVSERCCCSCAYQGADFFYLCVHIQTRVKSYLLNVVFLYKVHSEKLLFYMRWTQGGRAQPELNTPSSDYKSKSSLTFREEVLSFHTLVFLVHM